MKRKIAHPVERAIGYRFKDPALLEQALTHPSFAHEETRPTQDNQRLEYLGDAVLGFVAAEHLYIEMPNAPEGQLTQTRSSVTDARCLARAAAAIELGSHLRLGRGEERSGGRQRSRILADAFEALFGAAFLDGGLHAVRRLYRKHLVPLLPEKPDDESAAQNPKGQLQERLQADGRAAPQYTVRTETGPAHQRWFVVEVRCGDTLLGVGEGPSKREASADAARVALRTFTPRPPR